MNNQTEPETPRPDILTAMSDGTLTEDMVFSWALHPDGDMGPFSLMIYSFLQDRTLESRARVAAVEAERDRLKAELTAIANANQKEWDEEVRDQFQAWAQSRARFTLAALTPQGQSRDGETR